MLLDVHMHLDRYPPGADDVLAEIRKRRVFSIAVSMDPDSHARTVRLAEGESLVLPTFGVHPARAPQWADRLDEMQEALDRTPMVGEIGLDRCWVEDAGAYPAQERVFDWFLAAATQRDLAVNLHTKAAEDDIAAGLRKHDVRRAIVHWYAGPVRAFRALVDHGCWFSVGCGVLGDDVEKAIAAEIPDDRLLTETDNPGGWRWMTDAWGRPSLLIEIQRELARVRGMSTGDLQALVRANWERLIAGDARLEEPYRRAAASFEAA